MATVQKPTFKQRAGMAVLRHGGRMEARLHGFFKGAVKIDGLRMVYYSGGDRSKPTLLLVHGFTADKDVWVRCASHLLQQFFIVIPDLAGHGESDFDPSVNYSAASQAVRLVKLMDTLGVKRFHVAGNSMGGHVAVLLGADHADRTLSVTAVDPAGVKAPSPSGVVQRIYSGDNPFLIRSKQAFLDFYACTMAKAPLLPGFVLDGIAYVYQARREQYVLIFSHYFEKNDMDDRLADVKPPFFLIWGKQDAILDVSSVQVWTGGIPQAKVFIFDDLGHMPMLESPRKTAQKISAFVQEVHSQGGEFR